MPKNILMKIKIYFEIILVLFILIYSFVGYFQWFGQRLGFASFDDLTSSVNFKYKNFDALDLPYVNTYTDATSQFVTGNNQIPGYFLFGPYINLAAGRYKITIQGNGEMGAAANLNIAGDKGANDVLTFGFESKNLPVVKEFDIPNIRFGEIRFTGTTNAKIAISSYKIEKINIHIWTFTRQYVKSSIGSIKKYIQKANY